MSDDTFTATSQADAAYEAIRSLNHSTLGAVLPGPLAYDVIGNLKAAVNALPQSMNQIATGLIKAHSQFEMYEDDGGDPGERSALASDHLVRAGELAEKMANELEAAQQALSHQGYRQKETPGDADLKQR